MVLAVGWSVDWTTPLTLRSCRMVRGYSSAPRLLGGQGDRPPPPGAPPGAVDPQDFPLLQQQPRVGEAVERPAHARGAEGAGLLDGRIRVVVGDAPLLVEPLGLGE